MNTSTEVQTLVALLVPMALQLAKRSQLKWLAWLDQARPKICADISLLVGLLTATGLEFAHTANSVTITWPDLQTFVHGLVTVIVTACLQFGGQHVAYEGFWRHVIPAASNLPEGERSK